VKDYLYNPHHAYELISTLRRYYARLGKTPKFWLEEGSNGLLSVRSNISFLPPQNN
jgi:hypothetical protein